MERTSIAELRRLQDRVNGALGRPLVGWCTENGRATGQAGHVTLDGAYGKWKVAEILDRHGAQHDLSWLGTKAETELFLRGMLAGIERAR